MKETLRTRAKKGLFHGSNPPYGYEVIEGKLHIRNDDTPNIVKRIFGEYLAGSGRESIARRLYNEDIPTPADIAGKINAGDKWNDSTIKLILTNPHYVGDLVQSRSTTVSVTSKKLNQRSLSKTFKSNSIKLRNKSIEVNADGTPIIHYRFSAPKIK